MLDIMVEFSGNAELDNYLKGIFGNMEFFLGRVSWMIAQKNAKHIRNIKFIKSSPGGMLNSIQAKKLEGGGHGVIGLGKWHFIETGRSPGRRPPAPDGGPIQRWAGSRLGGYKLSSRIGSYGTRPTWFVRRGMASARLDWLQSLDTHLDYYVKSGGKIL